MTFSPIDSRSSYVPPDTIIPENWKDARLVQTDNYHKVANAINDRDIAHYDVNELVNGQKWFTPSDPNVFRQAFRRVVNFGALPNNTTKTAAHGITFNANSTVTRIYGAATNPSTSFIPLPYVELASGNNIQLDADGTNVTVITNADYSAYTSCYIVIEYLQN